MSTPTTVHPSRNSGYTQKPIQSLVSLRPTHVTGGSTLSSDTELAKTLAPTETQQSLSFSLRSTQSNVPSSHSENVSFPSLTASWILETILWSHSGCVSVSLIDLWLMFRSSGVSTKSLWGLALRRVPSKQSLKDKATPAEKLLDEGVTGGRILGQFSKSLLFEAMDIISKSRTRTLFYKLWGRKDGIPYIDQRLMPDCPESSGHHPIVSLWTPFSNESYTMEEEDIEPVISSRSPSERRVIA